MLLKIICTIIIINISLTQCKGDDLQSLGKLEKLTIKVGNKSEIHVEIKDLCSKTLLAQMESLRIELTEKFDNVLESNQFELAKITEKFDNVLLSNQFELAKLKDKFDNVLESNQFELANLTKKIDNVLQSNQFELAKLTEKFDTVFTLQPNQFPSSCEEATALTHRSGAYKIVVPGYSLQPIVVSCDENTQGGGWTIVLQRLDGSVNFYRDWQDYKTGFGNVNGEFFIGLDKLHEMTKNDDQELLIVMKNMAGEERFAKYDRFVIGNETDLYVLRSLGKYSGDAGDSLGLHLGEKFSSRDRDNDADDRNCAQVFTGAWWYMKCHSSNLMGKYNDSTYGKGVIWAAFAGFEASLKQVKMMIRQKR